MGKNSLVKSTTKKKKSTAKKKDEELATKSKKKATPKKAKAASKAKAAPKAKAKPAPKPKAKAAPKAKSKATPKPKKKPVSVKELLQKKFPVWKPEKIYTMSVDKADLKDVAAPPFVSGTEAEQKRIKELLLKKYDLAEIKAGGEKAAAEKAAAEKTAAEKTAAEKTAAEKTAAEKTAAEKTAAEKTAAEKTAAEKTAAEKAVADKAAEPEVSVSYEPPDSDDTIPSDPMEKGMKYLAAALAVLIALVIGSSMINQGKYYIHSTDGALEIYQGSFAPMGEELLISLPGVQQPAKAKDIYSKTDVFPLIFNYYVEKADTLLKFPGLPDFEGIKKYINKAQPYAVTPASKDIVLKRLNNIELMILLYKADVAASKPTLSDLKEAKEYLSEAERLDIDDIQLDLIHQKIDVVDEHITALKAEQKEVKSPAPAPAPAPQAKTKSPAPTPPK